MTRFPGIEVLLSLILLCSPLAATAEWCTGQFTTLKEAITTCGQVTTENTKRAQEIYRKLRRITGVSTQHDLVVVDIRDTPIAQNLKDGVVLSRQAVKICYQDVPQTEGDARIAFILGHELAHQKLGDHWRPAQNFSPEIDAMPDNFLAVVNEALSLPREMRADETGFIYAAVAGYPVNLLLGENDFFNYWESQKPGASGDSAEATRRAENLAQRLENLAREVIFFDYGTRLAHFEVYEDAYAFLQRFRLVFESPETLNNLGYISLQRARRYLFTRLTETKAVPYCLPVMLDTDNRAHSLLAPSTEHSLTEVRGEQDEIARERLLTALEAFEQATRLDKKYLPAWLNLAVTRFYLYLVTMLDNAENDEYLSDALHALGKAERLAPEHPDVLTVRALLIELQGEKANQDLWPESLEQLDLPTPCALYNQAVLKEQRKRYAEARACWQQLAVQEELPDSLRSVVCRYVECQTGARAAKATWTLPMTLGKDVPPKILSDWKMRLENTKVDSKTRVALYRQQDWEVLAVNGFVKLLVAQGSALKDVTPERLPAYCPGVLEKSTAAQGELWRCGKWSAWVADAQIREVWWVE